MCAVRALTWKAADLNRLRPARERANVNGSFSAAEMTPAFSDYQTRLLQIDRPVDLLNFHIQLPQLLGGGVQPLAQRGDVHRGQDADLAPGGAAGRLAGAAKQAGQQALPASQRVAARQQLGQALPLGHGAAVGQVDARAQLAQLAGQALRLGQQRGRLLGGAFALLGQRAGAQAVFHFIQPGLYVLSQDQRFRKFHFGYPPVYF